MKRKRRPSRNSFRSGFRFALIQLSHALAEDFGPTALLEAAILILSLWWLWIHTTWITNLLNTEVEQVRLLLLS